MYSAPLWWPGFDKTACVMSYTWNDLTDMYIQYVGVEIKWSLYLARECKGHVLKVKYTLPQEAQATKKNKVQRTRERSIACVTSAMVHSEPLRPVQPIPPGRKHNSPCQKNTSTSCTSPHWYSGFYAQRASCEMTCWIRAIISHAFIMLTSWEKR